MSRLILSPRPALTLSTLAALAVALPACIISGLPGDDDETATATEGATGPGDASTGGADESGPGDSADETAGDDEGTDETGGVVDMCDHEEVALHVYEHSGTIEGEHWPLGIHVVSGFLDVEGPLSVDPCSVIEMDDGVRLTVGAGGSLQWQGAPGEPITVTSAKASPSPGDWDYIRIRADSVGADNVMDYVIIEYGGGNLYGSVHLQPGASLAMSHGVVRHSGGRGMVIEADAELRDFVGNALTHNAEGALVISPDHVGDLGEGTYTPNTIEGIFLSGGTVAHDQLWLAHDAPYIAPTGFSVETLVGSAHLSVEAGTEIRLGDAADIFVGSQGGLTLAGTAADPIRLRSTKTTGSPGDWDEIRIEEDSVDAQNSFTHVEIEHGGGGFYGAVWVQGGASLGMQDSTIRASGDFAMLVDDGGELRDFTGNTLEDNQGAAMSIGANEVGSLGMGTYGPNAIDGIIVRNHTVDHDARWLDLGVPYLVSSGLRVGTNIGSAILTLSAGTELDLGDAGDIFVQTNGGLTADGTSDQHVVITSAKASPAAGDWDELRFEAGSSGPDNLLRYTDIAYGGGSFYGMVWVQGGATLDLDHASFDSPGGGCDLLRHGTVNAVASNYVECP